MFAQKMLDPILTSQGKCICANCSGLTPLRIGGEIIPSLEEGGKLDITVRASSKSWHQREDRAEVLPRGLIQDRGCA